MPSSNCKGSTSTQDDGEATDFSKLVLQEIGFVKESFEAVKIKASLKIDQANDAQNQFEELMLLPAERVEERDYKLRQLKMKVSKLRMEIPFKFIAPEEQPHPNIVRWRRLDSNPYGDTEISHIKPDIDDHNPAPPVPYHEIVSSLDRILFSQMLFVACFVFFPKNAVIKGSVLFSLLVAFSDTCDKLGYLVFLQVREDTSDRLGYLVEKGLVEVVYKKSNLTVDGYRMLPSLHSFLRSEESGLRGLADMYGWEDRWADMYGWADMYVGGCHEVEEKFIYHTAQDFQQLNDHNHTGQFEKTVLHLGKWNNSTEQHIEIIDPELFFKYMSKHTKLRSVSLRGISMIEELPEFITKLKKLRHLDLRACHNLEVIPSSIANLKDSLTYLDISECYFLDHMPKSLGSLVLLNVLKGFVVGENKDGKSCSLEDLASLHLLKKLNIYTSMKEFPNNSQLRTLTRFCVLSSLTISWGGRSSPNGLGKPRQEDEYQRFELITDINYVFDCLEKLDLQCVPETVTRRWLKPANFRYLKKLYIRGGNFFDLGQSSKGSKWNVEMLRLKHLSKLNINWYMLQRLFPKLICLEKVNCPYLDRFPCNDSGIWINNQQD